MHGDSTWKEMKMERLQKDKDLKALGRQAGSAAQW